MQNNLKILKAINFAAFKHRDQKRKDSNETPYINHPINVAYLITEVGQVYDSDVLCGAILHDTIEDTDTTFDELVGEFGLTIATIVQGVTDDKSLPKQVRKLKQIEKAKTLPKAESTIKIADKISNIKDIYTNPPKDWDDDRKEGYILWAKSVIKNLPDPNKGLLDLFNKTVDEFLAK